MNKRHTKERQCLFGTLGWKIILARCHTNYFDTAVIEFDSVRFTFVHVNDLADSIQSVGKCWSVVEERRRREKKQNWKNWKKKKNENIWIDNRSAGVALIQTLVQGSMQLHFSWLRPSVMSWTINSSVRLTLALVLQKGTRSAAMYGSLNWHRTSTSTKTIDIESSFIYYFKINKYRNTKKVLKTKRR